MPLEQKYNYKISDGIRYTPSEEEKVIRLLKDVRDNVSLLRPDLEKQRLEIILEVVEKGKWELQDLNVPNTKSLDSLKQIELIYNIDLSQAKNIIAQYRHDSEGGCESCVKRGHYMPFSDEHVFFCSKYESPEKLDFGNSPRRIKFNETGCDEKEPILKRKLEEVLKEHKNE